MNRDNAIAQLRDQTVNTADKVIPAVGTGQSVTRHLIKWGTGAPSGTPDAEIYVNVNGTWTALTIS